MEGNLDLGSFFRSDDDSPPLFLEFAKPRPRPEIEMPKDVILRAPGVPTGNPVMNEMLASQRKADYLERCEVERLTELTERTGMPITQENGQRRYGPPLDPEVAPPPRGSEVFVGKIPRDCYEPDLVPIFEKAGRIYEMRLMMDFSGTNRGYCFIHYFTPTEADRAIKELNGYEIRPRRRIGVVKSIDNCRLYIGNLPRDKQPEEIREEIDNLTDGVVKIVFPPAGNDQQRNRGYAFIEYESHRAAAMARRKFVPGNLQLWNYNIVVDWAEPENDVQTLFVKHVAFTTSTETLTLVFNQASENGVQNVKKVKDFAFIDFSTHYQADLAKAALDNVILDGSQIKVHWGRREGKEKEKDNNLSISRRSSGNRFRVEFDFDSAVSSRSSTSGFHFDRNRDSFKKPSWGSFPTNNHARANSTHFNFNKGNGSYNYHAQTPPFGFANNQIQQNHYPGDNLYIAPSAQQRSGFYPSAYADSASSSGFMNYGSNYNNAYKNDPFQYINNWRTNLM